MYQPNVAFELFELGYLERNFGEAERLRAEAIDEWEKAHPSLLTKFAGIFRRQPERPLMARSRIEADLIAMLHADARRSAI